MLKDVGDIKLSKLLFNNKSAFYLTSFFLYSNIIKK